MRRIGHNNERGLFRSTDINEAHVWPRSFTLRFYSFAPGGLLMQRNGRIDCKEHQGLLVHVTDVNVSQEGMNQFDYTYNKDCPLDAFPLVWPTGINKA